MSIRAFKPREIDSKNSDEKKAPEADALEIWTVKNRETGEKALAIELTFDGRDLNFRHTLTTKEDVEDVIRALTSCMNDCWPTRIPFKQVN